MTTTKEELRFLIENHYDIQKVRIQMGNQLFQMEERGVSEKRIQLLRESLYNGVHGIEKGIKKKIEQSLENYIIWQEWLSGIKGIGPILAGGILAWVSDIKLFDTVSKLWAYSGYHVVDGKAPKRTRGQKCNWNTRLRTHLWKVGESFVKSKGPYRAYYEQFRKFYDEKHADKTKGHRYAMAKRKVVKLFLSHLWEKWRGMEGLEVGEPYVIGKLKHKSYIAPPEPDIK